MPSSKVTGSPLGFCISACRSVDDKFAISTRLWIVVGNLASAFTIHCNKTRQSYLLQHDLKQQLTLITARVCVAPSFDR